MWRNLPYRLQKFTVQCCDTLFSFSFFKSNYVTHTVFLLDSTSIEGYTVLVGRDFRLEFSEFPSWGEIIIIKQPMFIMCLLYTKYYSKHFRYVDSFTPQNHSMRLSYSHYVHFTMRISPSNRDSGKMKIQTGSVALEHTSLIKKQIPSS